MQNIKEAVPGIWDIGFQNNAVVADVYGTTRRRVVEGLINAIKALAEAFRTNGFEDVCEGCGKTHTDISSYYIGGAISNLCNECYGSVNQSLQQSEIEKENTKENVVAGVVGAFFGSLIGVLCIVLVAQLGYVASISGLVMGVCTVIGYEKLAKKLSVKGIIVVVIMMLVMTYFADKISWCVAVVQSSDWSFFEVFRNFWSLLNYAGAKADFVSDLTKVYIFTIIGGVPTIFNAIKNQKVAYDAYQIQ